jgi:Tol biopolymer transport system component
LDSGGGLELEHPDWSPDGRWIDYNTTGDCGGACERIERVPANDSKAKLVVLYQEDAKGGYKPTYSPDGTSIVFGCRGGSLCRMNADGTNVAVLKENQGLEFNHFDWRVTPKAGD